MIEIAEALKAKYDLTPEMQEGVTGGFHLDHPGAGRPRPFIALVLVAGSTEFQTGPDYLEDCQIQISIFANTAKEIKPIRKRWIRALTRQPLYLPEGLCIGAQFAGEQFLFNQEETDAQSAWHCVLEFTFTQQQSI